MWVVTISTKVHVRPLITWHLSLLSVCTIYCINITSYDDSCVAVLPLQSSNVLGPPKYHHCLNSRRSPSPCGRYVNNCVNKWNLLHAHTCLPNTAMMCVIIKLIIMITMIIIINIIIATQFSVNSIHFALYSFNSVLMMTARFAAVIDGRPIFVILYRRSAGSHDSYVSCKHHS